VRLANRRYVTVVEVIPALVERIAPESCVVTEADTSKVVRNTIAIVD